MKIIVNDEPIDFSLQGETNLGEIVPTLRDWLAESEYTITALSADGEQLAISSEESWRERSLDQIETLTLEAHSLLDERLNAIDTALEFLTLLRRIIAAGNQERLGEAMAEYEYLREALPTLLSVRPTEGKEMREYFEELLNSSGASNGKLPKEEAREELLKRADILINLLKSRAKELLDPEEEYRSVARAVAASLSSVEEVPVLLQTGEGNEAMRRIAGFTGLVERLLRLYHRFDETDGSEAHVEGLNEVLEELVQALGEEDTVLVGDLVEYEVVPKMERFLKEDGIERPATG